MTISLAFLAPELMKAAATRDANLTDYFKSIADRHNFPPDFPSPDVASGLMALLIAHPNFYSTLAELDGRIVGSNFLDERTLK
jgi:hypothetical protein